MRKNVVAVKRLEEKVAIISGAASGIGRAGARLFARHGCSVTVADIDSPKGEQTAQAIRDEGGQALFVEVDMGDAQQVERMVERTVDHWGGVDILFTCAAPVQLINTRDACVVDLEEDVFDEIHRVTMKGVYLCAKYAGRSMIERGGGAMVFTATVDAQVGCADLDAYTAAKGGIVSMTRSLAAGLAGRGIRVNAICPGFVATEGAPFTNDPLSRREIESLHLLPVPGPEGVVPLALFLASDEAQAITGSIHQVDAGYTAFKSGAVNIMDAVRRTPTSE